MKTTTATLLATSATTALARGINDGVSAYTFYNTLVDLNFFNASFNAGISTTAVVGGLGLLAEAILQHFTEHEWVKQLYEIWKHAINFAGMATTGVSIATTASVAITPAMLAAGAILALIATWPTLKILLNKIQPGALQKLHEVLDILYECINSIGSAAFIVNFSLFFVTNSVNTALLLSVATLAGALIGLQRMAENKKFDLFIASIENTSFILTFLFDLVAYLQNSANFSNGQFAGTIIGGVAGGIFSAVVPEYMGNEDKKMPDKAYYTITGMHAEIRRRIMHNTEQAAHENTPTTALPARTTEPGCFYGLVHAFKKFFAPASPLAQQRVEQLPDPFANAFGL